MSGYFDPHADAQMLGFTNGHLQGKQEGFKQGATEGYNEGYTDGHKDGYEKGWVDAINRANQEMLKQIEFTKKHVADKQLLQTQLSEQAKLIEQLQAKLDAMERENADLKQKNQGLREVVDALKAANERLQAEVDQLDEKFEKQTEEYAEQVWQYNRSLCFTNAVRSVLEELTAPNDSEADRIREMFAKRYAQEVNESLNDGSIRMSPDKDKAFAEAMPKTQKFIVEMLTKVAQHAPKEIRENMLEQAAQESEDHSPSM
jgi:chromosome segregation ATPase